MSVVRIRLSNGRTLQRGGRPRAGAPHHQHGGVLGSGKGGMTLNAFTDSCIRYTLGETALTDEQQTVHSTGILAFVLRSETGDPEHPGRFVDYLGITDFEVSIIDDDGGFDIDARVKFGQSLDR